MKENIKKLKDQHIVKAGFKLLNSNSKKRSDFYKINDYSKQLSLKDSQQKLLLKK
jgi:hypothetical protein